MKTTSLSITLILFTIFSLHAKDAAKVLDPISKTAKHPRGVNLKLMSDDKTYGYSDKNPIKVGSKEEYGGPKAKRAYLALLLGPDGKPVTFNRLGSGGSSPDGNLLDMYQVTLADGQKVILWLNMYYPKNKPEKQLAPAGQSS